MIRAATFTLTALLLAALAGCTPTPNFWADCLVIDKDRVATSTEGRSDMRVYTENCGEFKIADRWGRNDSARVYGSIQPGRRYDIEAVGTRNPSWSQFPNITAVHPKG